MQDNFTIFWQNNDRALALFDDLAARMERGAYDDGGYWAPQDVGERVSSDRKVRRVLRDCLAKQPQDATPVLPGRATRDAADGTNGTDDEAPAHA